MMRILGLNGMTMLLAWILSQLGVAKTLILETPMDRVVFYHPMQSSALICMRNPARLASCFKRELLQQQAKDLKPHIYVTGALTLGFGSSLLGIGSYMIASLIQSYRSGFAFKGMLVSSVFLHASVLHTWVLLLRYQQWKELNRVLVTMHEFFHPDQDGQTLTVETKALLKWDRQGYVNLDLMGNPLVAFTILQRFIPIFTP